MRKTGLTLIELILTIVVVGIVAVPLSLVIAQNCSSVFYSEGVTTAFNLARLEMETVNNLSYASVANAAFSSYQGYGYNVTRTVSYVYGTVTSAESLKKISIQVKRVGDSAVLATLVAYRANNVSYGL